MQTWQVSIETSHQRVSFCKGNFVEIHTTEACGNTGATWLAPSEEINNPYLGLMMLRCGEVRHQLTQE
jgi:hypothetical protein